MRRCKCGCSQFQAHQKQLWSVIVSWDRDGVVETDNDGNYMKDSKYPDGPYSCVECGTVYERESDIPDDEEPDEI